MRMKRPNGKNGGIHYIYLADLGLILKDTVYQVPLTLPDKVENVVLPLKMELKLRNFCAPVSLDLPSDTPHLCMLPCLAHTQDEARGYTLASLG